MTSSTAGADRAVWHNAFEEVALPHLEAVAGFAVSLTHDEAEANDLVQETYLRALKGWHTFTIGTDCRKWLFTICRNTFLQMRTRQKRLVESQESDPDALAAARSHAAASREGLGDLFDQLEVGPAIARAVGELPEPHHSILVLVDLEGLSYEEAAEVLEIPVGTVRSRLYRARRKVQDALVDHARDMGLAGGIPATDQPSKERS